MESFLKIRNLKILNPNIRNPNNVLLYLSIIGIWVFGFGVLLNGCGESDRKLTSITVSPSSATVGINKSLRFSAAAYDQKGLVLPAEITWAVSNSAGTIDSTGMFYAGSAEIGGSVTATAQGVSGSASVTVSSKGTIAGTVRSADGAIAAGIRVYLSATGLSDTSSSTGRYTLSGLAAGTWEVRTGENAQYIGTSAEVTLGIAETKTLDVTIYPRFSVYSESINGPPVTTVSGSVRNNGTTEAKGVGIVYVFYDETGLIVGGAQGNLGNIAAQGTSAFSAVTGAPIDSYSNYQRTISAASY